MVLSKYLETIIVPFQIGFTFEFVKQFYLTQHQGPSSMLNVQELKLIKNTILVSSCPPTSLIFKGGGHLGSLAHSKHTITIDLKPISNGTSITICYTGPAGVEIAWIYGPEFKILQRQLLEDPRYLFDAATKAELAGRHEDAAVIWEKLNDHERAGKVRERAKVQTIKHINVDINSLLNQMRAGGLVSVYKCPNCGASIKISGDTSTSKLSRCEFCGTTLQIDDIAKFIQNILT